MLQSATIDKLKAEIDKLPQGKTFTLPELLGPHWDSNSGGGSAGKHFKDLVAKGVEIRGVRFVGVKDGKAFYEKRG